MKKHEPDYGEIALEKAENELRAQQLAEEENYEWGDGE